MASATGKPYTMPIGLDSCSADWINRGDSQTGKLHTPLFGRKQAEISDCGTTTMNVTHQTQSIVSYVDIFDHDEDIVEKSVQHWRKFCD
jgi:hypothetical protein